METDKQFRVPWCGYLVLIFGDCLLLWHIRRDERRLGGIPGIAGHAGQDFRLGGEVL